MNAMCRSLEYTDEIGERICELLSEGVPLKRICKMDGMPSYVTVLKWQTRVPEFADLSARAKADGTHALADEALEIADRDDLDPADKRIRIDTRIRLIGKWNSRAYGDKVINETDITMRRIERVETVILPPPEREVIDVTPVEDDE